MSTNSTTRAAIAPPDSYRDEHWYIILRAGDGVQTRDLHLGKVALYQLSYSRLLLKEHPPKRRAKVIKILSLQNSINDLFVIFLANFNAQKKRWKTLNKIILSIPAFLTMVT